MRPRLTLQNKLMLGALAIALAVPLLFATLVFPRLERAAESKARDLALAETGSIARVVALDFAGFLGVTGSGADSLAALIAGKALSRGQIVDWLRAQLAANPKATGMAIALEPDVLGPDAEAKGQPGSDAAGRFVPYAFYTQGAAIDATAIDMTTPDVAVWYTPVIAANRSQLSEPYLYEVEGKPVLMVTSSAVIRREGAAVGVVTYDTSLAALSERLAALSPLGGGQVMLISGAGNWVAHPNSALQGKPVDPALLAALGEVPEGALGHWPEAAGEDIRFVVLPVETGLEGKPWRVVMRFPASLAFGDLITARNIALGLAAGVLLVTLAGSLWAARGFVRPIQKVTESLERIAREETDFEIEGRLRRDEIGAMLRAVEVLKSFMAERGRLQAASVAAKADQDAVVRTIEGALQRLAEGDMTRPIEGADGRPFPEDYHILKEAYNSALARLNRALGGLGEVALFLRQDAEIPGRTGGQPFKPHRDPSRHIGAIGSVALWHHRQPWRDRRPHPRRR